VIDVGLAYKWRVTVDSIAAIRYWLIWRYRLVARVVLSNVSLLLLNLIIVILILI